MKTVLLLCLAFVGALVVGDSQETQRISKLEGQVNALRADIARLERQIGILNEHQPVAFQFQEDQDGETLDFMVRMQKQLDRCCPREVKK